MRPTSCRSRSLRRMGSARRSISMRTRPPLEGRTLPHRRERSISIEWSCVARMWRRAEQKYVEEFSVSNFLGIASDGSYCTPASGSILPSITNKMLMQLAADKGIDVQARLISIDEIASFREVGACGTATVCVPIASITNGSEKLQFGKFDVLNSLREELMAIQLGDAEDKHGWMREVQC